MLHVSRCTQLVPNWTGAKWVSAGQDGVSERGSEVTVTGELVRSHLADRKRIQRLGVRRWECGWRRGIYVAKNDENLSLAHVL